MESHPTWMLRLKIRHLEVFRALVESGSQSATAARLHVTQPALSKWLRELEENAGCDLFKRGRPLRLTVYGQVLLRYAERVLGDSLRTGQELDALRVGDSGHLRVGVLRTVAAMLVPAAITRYRKVAPGVRITIHEDTLDNLLPKLERHELDCVIGRLQPRQFALEYRSEALYEEPVCAVVRAQHPLVSRRRISWKEAARYPWILPLPGAPMRARVEAEFASAGLSPPRHSIESDSLLTNETLLQETDMINIVSRQLAMHYAERRGVRILPLAMRHVSGPVGMMWLDAHPAAALARFLDAVRAAAKERVGRS